MSNITGCRYCGHSDTKRKNSEGKIRCRRYSQWVGELGTVCESFTQGILPLLKEIAEDKELEEIRKVKEAYNHHIEIVGGL